MKNYDFLVVGAGLYGCTIAERLHSVGYKVLVIDNDAYIVQFVPYNSSDSFKTRTIKLDDEESMSKLTYHKVVSVNKLKFNNRAARLKLIGR